MLYTILLILVILWLIGNLPSINSSLPNGNLIHILLVVIVFLIILKLLGVG